MLLIMWPGAMRSEEGSVRLWQPSLGVDGRQGLQILVMDTPSPVKNFSNHFKPLPVVKTSERLNMTQHSNCSRSDWKLFHYSAWIAASSVSTGPSSEDCFAFMAATWRGADNGRVRERGKISNSCCNMLGLSQPRLSIIFRDIYQK